MQGLAGLIEMLLFFGIVLGWAGWQVWGHRKWKRQQQQLKAEQAKNAAPDGPNAEP